MIKFVKGNLLDAEAQALVNTVNTVGVMGKGIALQFKNRYPLNYKVYRDACKKGTFSTGQILSVRDGDLLNQKYIFNFPTKAHWKAPSKIEYIKTGLAALREEIVRLDIKSIAIPPLGCGNGGLQWTEVRPLIVEALSDLDIDLIIYEPNAHIKQTLQQETVKKVVSLTPARAMILYLLFHYENAGEQSSLFVANKLAYFLQRKGEKLRLKFEPYHYGPYAVQLNHVLLNMNGVFLKGMEQNVAGPFEPLHLNYDKLDQVNEFVSNNLEPEQKNRLDEVLQLLCRFESTFALELLATVDFIVDKEDTKNVDEILDGIFKWSKRKTKIFKSEQVELALNHLLDHASNPFQAV